MLCYINEVRTAAGGERLVEGGALARVPSGCRIPGELFAAGFGFAEGRPFNAGDVL